MKKLIRALPVALMFVALTAVPTMANNDPVAPGDNCSGNPVAIGQPPDDAAPIGNNATDNPGDAPSGDQVDGPASENNPGSSDGAAASEHFNGGTRC